MLLSEEDPFSLRKNMDGINESKRKIQFGLEPAIKRIKIEDDTVEKTPEIVKENVSEYQELASLKSQLEQNLTRHKKELLDAKKEKKERKAKLRTLTMELHDARVDFTSLQDDINLHKAKMSCKSIDMGIVSDKCDNVRLELLEAQKRLDELKALGMHAGNKLESSQDLVLANAQKEVVICRDLHTCLLRLVASLNEDILKYETEIEILAQKSNPLKEKVSKLETQLEQETAALELRKDEISKLQHDININSSHIIFAKNQLEYYSAWLLRPREWLENLMNNGI